MLKVNEVESLFAEADRATHGRRCEISNLLAKEVMGWHLDENDSRRLWRREDGSAVQWTLNTGWVVRLCMHPWVDGTNGDDDVAFGPAQDRRKFVDWRQVVRDELASRSVESPAAY
ncbi:hypothetical protein [Ottowia sp.]|uniref:hypothetical protein n=1 Tax=Ottowia sp. TaxID=1898956 RepID=UPI0025FAD3D9|nr:hypothetical protein [Ottowia sp.]MBK6616088.1 hypothetical protein [Ottowia sp.]